MARRRTEPRRGSGVLARDEGLHRLSRLTRLTVAGATVLTGVFAGLAAESVPGRHVTRLVSVTRSSVAGATRRAGTTERRTTTRSRSQAPDPAPTPAPAPAPQPQPALQPPPQPPAPAPAPPVVVSGGS